MNSYYDSDDDVAWGPLTLREIKRTFRDPHTRKVSRRQTIESKCLSLASQTKEVPKIMINTIDDENPHFSKLPNKKQNLTGSSNEYYTPNVTMNPEKHVCLVNADSSVYASCDDKENTGNNNIFEDTHVKFLDLAKNRKTNLYLDNIHQTLVDPSTCELPNHTSTIEEHEDEVHDSCYMNSFDSSKSSEQYEDNNIIVLSSDEENHSFITKRKLPNSSFHNISVKMEHMDLHDSTDSDKLSIGNQSSTEESNQVLNEDGIGKWNSSNLNGNVTIGAEAPLPSVDFSPVQVPKIDLAGFDESEDCLELNTTLDEIERLLNTADGSPSSSSSLSGSSSPVDANISYLLESPQSVLSPVQIISGSFSQSPSSRSHMVKELNLGKINKPIQNPAQLEIPIEIPTTSSGCSKKDFVSKIAVPTNNFRVPKTPTVVKSKPGVMNSKKIVSPVGLYIKYSPQSPLLTHVKNTKPKNVLLVLPEQQSPQAAKGGSRDMGELPTVVYRPAKKKLYSVKENLFLPPSIDRLVKKSEVVKHEGRTHFCAKNTTFIERKLQEDTDLTNNTIGNSLLDGTDPDVSVLASRQAFGK